MSERRRAASENDDTLAADDLHASGGRSARSSFAPSVSVLAGRYELSAMLGAGGMGTVFRAKDLELDEIVALKVLNPELVDSIDALGRFKAEVKLARRVTHANVARTFDFGTHGELRFLTMEYVDGLSLEERIVSDPWLTPGEIIALVRSILQGLGAAHAAGVLHRDLKPANVMLGRDGRVLLMDFGIAHALEIEDRERRTKNGLVGTPLYMSPEQVEGARDLDGRSDLYALGLMIHEMATREVPFDGPSPFAVAAARLLRPAPKFEFAGSPPWFTALVDRLVAVKRADRPESAAAALGSFVDDSSPRLSQAAVASAPVFVEPTQRAMRLAVLTLVSEERTSHVARALGEELAELLASTPRAQVVMGSPLAGESPRDVGRRLGVDLVLEGQVQEAEGLFAVRLRLSTVAEGFLLFATRTRDALPALPRWLEGAARALADALETKVSASNRAPTDAMTLDLYFRGRQEFHKRWRESGQRARDLLSQAYARSPDDPAIVSAYALVLTRLFGFAYEMGSDGATRGRGENEEELAERMVARANALAPGRADVMMANAALAYQTGDFERTAQVLHGVLDRNPQHADALDLLGRILTEVGPADEAFRVLELARAADPQLISTPLEIARVLGLQGKFAEAERILRTLDGSAMPRALVAFATHRILKLWRRDRTSNSLLEGVIGDPTEFSPQEQMAVRQFLFATQEAAPEVSASLAPLLRAALTARPRQVRRGAFNAQVRAEVLALHAQWDEVLVALEDADRCLCFDELWIDGMPLFEPLRGTARFEAVRASLRERAARMRAQLPLAGTRSF